MAFTPANSHGLGLPLGLAGAATPTRYVGGNASGAPATGTFAAGDYTVNADGSIYICTVAGSPGTWVAVSGGAGGSEPWLVQINPFLPPASNTGWSTYFFYAAGELIRYGTAQNDLITWKVALSAGTWTLSILGDSGPDRAINTVTLSTVGALGTIDSYTAGSANPVTYSIAGIVIPTTAAYTLQFQVATKNALSSAFIFALNAIQLRRTA